MKLNKLLLRNHNRQGRRLPDTWVHPDVDLDHLPKINCPERALHCIRWLQKYTCHVTGTGWQGVPFRLLPWQFLAIWQSHGQLRPDGFRQYRWVYIQIPKKSGKSELASGLSLYHLCGEGEKGAEVYLLAKDRLQASIVYDPAAFMATHNPTLSSKLKVLRSTRRIVYSPTTSKLVVLSRDSKNKSGFNPSALFFDELHEMEAELFEIMTADTNATRDHQLIWMMTTAGVYEQESIYNRTKLRALSIARDPSIDKSFLPILYLPEKDEDFENPSEELIRRVNPAIPYLFSYDKIKESCDAAKNNPDKKVWQNFKRFRLNIDISHVDAFMDMRAWMACEDLIDEESLRGRLCFGGLDPSLKKDLSAFVLAFPPRVDGEKWIFICRFWCPRNSIVQRTESDKVPYQIWADEGYITTTDGDIIDQHFIISEINNLREKYHISEIGYDENKGHHMASALLNDHDAPMVNVYNSFKNMSEPSQKILELVTAGLVNHGRHPILSWNWENTIMIENADGLIRIDKKKRVERIDGSVAMVIAMNRALAYLENKTGWGSPNVPLQVIGG